MSQQPKVGIRPIKESDLDDLAELWNELSAYYLSLQPVFPLRWQRPSAAEHRFEVLRKAWEDPNNFAGFLATVDGELAGFVRAEINPDGPADASIHSLYVRPNFQRHGLGRTLMDRAIVWCEEQGANEVSLDVLPANTRAAAFHASMGFQPFITSWVKRLK